MGTFNFARKRATLAAVSALAIVNSANTAAANDLVKGLAGAAAGAIIYCGVTNNCKGKQRTTTTQRAPQPWSAERQQRAAVQTALNDFGYPVGKADGVYGGKTRTGVSNYQAAMGYPITGNLTPYEQQVLLGAHNSYKTGVHNSTYPGLYATEGAQGLVAGACGSELL